jgi:hypothetical protein
MMMASSRGPDSFLPINLEEEYLMKTKETWLKGNSKVQLDPDCKEYTDQRKIFEGQGYKCDGVAAPVGSERKVSKKQQAAIDAAQKAVDEAKAAVEAAEEGSDAKKDAIELLAMAEADLVSASAE